MAWLLALLLALALPADPASIAGAVVDAASGQPIAKARVDLTVRLAGKDLGALAWTDSRGYFRFDTLPAGSYGLYVSRSGYASWTGRPIQLKADQAVTVRMRRPSTLSGKITTAAGDLFPNASVNLYRPQWHRGKRFWTLAGGTTTDDRGEYRIYDVAAGEYRIRAQSFTLLREDLKSYLGVPRFYGQTENAESAAAIEVRPGEEVRRIDVQLPLERAATVKVKIDPPAPRAQILLQADNGLMNNSLSPELVEVPPGPYRLYVIAQIGERTHTADIPVTVNGDIEVAVNLTPPVDIAGNVVLEGTFDALLSVLSVKIASGERFSRPQIAAATAGKDHSFVLRNVTPGIWDVGVDPLPEGAYIKSVTFEGKDVLIDDMVITPESRGPLVITVGAKSASVTGKVDAESAWVVLAPWGARRDAWGFFHAVEANGTFRINNIVPGVYRAFALEERLDAALQSTAVLDRVADAGVAVKLGEGGTANLELRVIRGLP